MSRIVKIKFDAYTTVPLSKLVALKRVNEQVFVYLDGGMYFQLSCTWEEAHKRLDEATDEMKSAAVRQLNPVPDGPDGGPPRPPNHFPVA